MKAFEQAVEQILPTASFAQVDLVGPTVSTEFSTGGRWRLAYPYWRCWPTSGYALGGIFAGSALTVLFLNVTKTFGVIALMG